MQERPKAGRKVDLSRSRKEQRTPRAPKEPTLESNAPKETRKRPEGEPEATKGRKGVASRKTTEPKKSVADIDGVYVLQANGQLFIKRVTRRMDGAHVITSDNPSVRTVDILDGSHPVRICGRVVYGWNGRRF